MYFNSYWKGKAFWWGKRRLWAPAGGKLLFAAVFIPGFSFPYSEITIFVHWRHHHHWSNNSSHSCSAILKSAKNKRETTLEIKKIYLESNTESVPEQEESQMLIISSDNTHERAGDGNVRDFTCSSAQTARDYGNVWAINTKQAIDY